MAPASIAEPISALTEETAVEALQHFFHEKPFVFFGTGMSCALDSRFGMAALREVLIRDIGSSPLTNEQNAEWEKVQLALNSGADLESALNSVSDRTLLGVITAVTGDFVASVDREYCYRIAQGSCEWPAARLITKLVETLPEGDRILDVVTPNYDLLFEYTCDLKGIPYSNGFVGGVSRAVDWDAARRSLLLPENVLFRGRMRTIFKPRKHVRLYKVHGSLNYFFYRGNVVENESWMWSPPPFVQRVMITPGSSKYETLQRYRQELLASADSAIDRASHFLFLGYGFNDGHLEEYIKRKLITQRCKGVIITRDCNSRIESLLRDAANLWIVCKAERTGSEGTRVFNSQYSDWLQLPDRKLWDVKEFTTQVLGG